MARKVRLTQVSTVHTISPNLKRIVLSGAELEDFPTGQDGAHVKVLFPHPGEILPNLDFNGDNPALKRSYTIREFNPLDKQLVIDFVVNRHRGPATDWAANAKVGDYIGIAGPGVRKLTDFNADSYLLIGDITAVNAVNGYAKFIPPHAALTAIVTVPTKADIIEMDAGEHLKVHWHIEDESSLDLLGFVRSLVANLATDSQVFIGLEASQLRELKSLLLHELDFERINIHATGYWKKGMDADRFSADKKSNPV